MIITDLENGKYCLTKKYTWNGQEKVAEKVNITVRDKEIFMKHIDD